jgi:hypothetical protein
MNAYLALVLLIGPIVEAGLAGTDAVSLARPAESGPNVRLELLLTSAESLPPGAIAPFEIWLINDGESPVSLIEPGDGSAYGWRTPLVQWLSGRSDRELGPPVLLPRCGNMNQLQAKEVFTLQPGERRKLGDWTHAPSFAEAGEWNVRLRYRNDPQQTWRDERDLDPAVARLVRESSAIDIVSNEVTVTVAAP